MEARSRAMQVGGLIGIIAFPVVILAMYLYASRPEPDSVQVVRCGETVEGRKAPAIALTKDQCAAIAQVVPPTEAPDQVRVSAANDAAAVIDVGKLPPPNVEVRGLPAEVTDRFPGLNSYRYFVAGNDIALVEPSSGRIVSFVEVHRSPRTPAP